MSPAPQNPPLGLILKAAMAFAVLLYGAVAVAVLGAPAWDRPWIPAEAPGSLLATALPAVAFVCLVAGFLLGRRPLPEGAVSSTGQPAHVTRFVVGAALVEGGAIVMLALAFVAKDSRWAVLGALPAVILIAMAPASAEGGAGAPPA